MRQSLHASGPCRHAPPSAPAPAPLSPFISAFILTRHYTQRQQAAPRQWRKADEKASRMRQPMCGLVNHASCARIFPLVLNSSSPRHPLPFPSDERRRRSSRVDWAWLSPRGGRPTLCPPHSDTQQRLLSGHVSAGAPCQACGGASSARALARGDER